MSEPQLGQPVEVPNGGCFSPVSHAQHADVDLSAALGLCLLYGLVFTVVFIVIGQAVNEHGRQRAE